MTWWVTQPGRARAERVAVADLQARAEWLHEVRWRLCTGLGLALDASIVHGDETFPLTLAYPAYFPDTPPTVTPTDGRIISGHQYGRGGELCLEFRADNWEPSITGAMMLESAHRLIAGERDLAANAPVASAHLSTPGQDLRGATCRLLLSASALQALQTLPERLPIPLRLGLRIDADVVVAAVEGVGEDDRLWTGDRILLADWRRTAIAVRLGVDQALPARPSLAEIEALLRVCGTGDIVELGANPSDYLLLVDVSGPRLFMLYEHEGERKACPFRAVLLPDEGGVRNHPEHAALADKRVGIVGCGSLGSKIAASLARSGVARFVLIDHDLLFPGNLARNELDRRAIGLHKADATRARLLEISSECEVAVRKIALGGQESAEATLSVMEELSGCDLILDATADPHVFNYCAAVARRHLKPLLWAEVFGGGIGGLVARARPGVDPPPQAARRQIASWCEARGVPAPAIGARDYASTGSEGTPLVADDGDVAVIAAHAARLATDTLGRELSSIFDSPAYAVGLARSWIFAAAFDTWPIDYAHEGGWGAPAEENASQRALELLAELVPAADNDHDHPAS